MDDCSRLRIMVDLTPVRPGGETGGAKYFIFEFLRFIGERYYSDFEFVFLTSSANHCEIRQQLARSCDELVCVREEAGFSMPVASAYSPKEQLWLSPLADLAIELKTNVVYCPFGMVDYACPGIPTVTLIVDVLHRDYPYTLSPDGVEFRERFFAEAVARSDYFQCISQFTTKRMIALYGVENARLFHTYIPIHHRLGSSPDSALSGVLPVKGFFYYPANAWIHKNHESLLLAYRIYRQRVGDTAWPLVLTGHEDARFAQLKAITVNLGIAENTHFLGFVSKETLAQLWHAAGALIFPSLHEGFGIPLLEAMQHATPILANDACSIPEVGGEACLYVDARKPLELAEGLWRIAHDMDLCKKLIAAGTKRLQAFSLEQEAGKLADCFQRCASGWPRFSMSGIYVDGWISEAAVLSLPPCEGRGVVEIVFTTHAPQARLLVYLGDRPFGSFRCADYRERGIRIPFAGPQRFLRLRVIGAEHLSVDVDHRRHGVHLARLAFIDSAGTETILWPKASLLEEGSCCESV
ncbi:MAG: glycosyltransferase family 4 protein [Gammaproteobacteria bacterium]|nr:glycosyltransferase family 4 protein [Gammaproteobacteria bacterium]